MAFEILGEITRVETIAAGREIRELARLVRLYGLARWRKRKGIARVRLADGTIGLAELHWYEAHRNRKARTEDQETSELSTTVFNDFALCVKDGGYPASLEARKIYRVLPDPDARSHGMIRIVDESGEDYLYPEDLFVPIEVPTVARPAFHGV